MVLTKAMGMRRRVERRDVGWKNRRLTASASADCRSAAAMARFEAHVAPRDCARRAARALAIHGVSRNSRPGSNPGAGGGLMTSRPAWLSTDTAAISRGWFKLSPARSSLRPSG